MNLLGQRFDGENADHGVNGQRILISVTESVALASSITIRSSVGSSESAGGLQSSAGAAGG